MVVMGGNYDDTHHARCGCLSVVEMRACEVS